MTAPQVSKHDLLQQARSYRKSEQLDRAQEYLNKILVRYPQDILALNEMGIIFIKLGDLIKASSYFEKILRIKPSDPYALNQLGVIYNRQGDTERAIEAFKKVLESHPTNIHALSELGLTYSRIGDTDNALCYFKQISSISRGTLEQLKDSKNLLRKSEKVIKDSRYLLRRSEREIKEKEAQLIAAGRITTANAMATSLAHQINNPLQIIQTIVYKLIRKIPPDQTEIKENLTKIQLHADRIHILIAHLNKLIKDEPDEYSYFDISEVIHSACSLFDEQLKSRRIRLNLSEVDNNNWLIVYGNQIKLEQVFINLIANARDALRHTRRAEITISTNQSNEQNVVIHFRDNGKGIPEKNIDRIFESLYTTKQGGTGLGLWLCSSVIQQMNGTIEVESIRKKGTKFIIALPNRGGNHA
jgi:signal transduction histidine kinase